MLKLINLKNILINSPILKKKKNINLHIKDIFIKLNIPEDYLIYVLIYLVELVKINNNNYYKFINNKKIYIFTCIILFLKFNLDEKLNINFICDVLNINFNLFLETEIYIVKELKWNLFINENKILEFKRLKEHYKDWDHILDLPY